MLLLFALLSCHAIYVSYSYGTQKLKPTKKEAMEDLCGLITTCASNNKANGPQIRSVFYALSIGGGLAAAVDPCV